MKAKHSEPTASLENFQRICLQIAEHFAAYPGDDQQVRVSLNEDATLHLQLGGPDGFHCRPGQPFVYPIATFNQKFPDGLPFLTNDLEAALWAAHAARFRQYREAKESAADRRVAAGGRHG